MKKRQAYLLTATLTAALALVACKKEQNAVVEQPDAAQIPVAFGAYVNRSTTKAGLFSADLVLNKIKKNDVGFGVFAYYTNADTYDQSFTPNFMYNQHVLFKPIQSTNDSTWQYSPVKYWPNEFGSNAQSDDVDKISFFAYSPYVSVNPASGKVNGDGSVYAGDNGNVTWGIVGMKRNNATGDPMIQYKVSGYTNQQVDLVWGTASSETWELKNGGSQTGIVAGKPLLNIQHPYKTSSVTVAGGHATSNAQRVAFDFKHALAKLYVTVDTKTNGTTPAAPSFDYLTKIGTKVFIRSVTFEGFATKGALNLNNAEVNEALWYNFDCNNELDNGEEFTIYDGRRDGKEGLTAANKEYAAINPIFVQDTVWAKTERGVVEEARNLFGLYGLNAISGSAPILVIPNGDKLKVTIEYDVLTTDDNLAGMLNDGETHGSVVKNVISRWITKNTGTGDPGDPVVPGTGNPAEPSAADAIILENGKIYNIALHLGLNSVEFDATVSGWASGGTGGADLPHNN